MASDTQANLPLAGRPGRIRPYWIVIALLVAAGAALYGYHLATGRTPDRVALRLDFIDFDVFWYGIIIVGGVVLGAWVVAHLAAERAAQLFAETVPIEVRERPVARLPLPAKVRAELEKRAGGLGELLFEFGLAPERLGLNRAEAREVGRALRQAPGVRSDWVQAPAWRRFSPDHVWGGVAWCLVLAIVFARLYHVLTPSPSMAAVGINSPLDYFRQPLQLINLRNGGLGIYGGIFGGALGLWLYTRRHHLPALTWADLGVVGVALGQAVGRWANFFNQELYGRPTDLPWAVQIDPLYRLQGFEDVARYHPAFIYESLCSLLAFFVLLRLVRRGGSRPGEVTAVYLILYGIGRILLETVRLDSRSVELGSVSVPVASLVSAGVILAMVAILIGRRLAGRS
ncbi:MAG: prolipoprotein diacylglyceryl transferase [Candidatus Promineifilaceae bacterium]